MNATKSDITELESLVFGAVAMLTDHPAVFWVSTVVALGLLAISCVQAERETRERAK